MERFFWSLSGEGEIFFLSWEIKRRSGTIEVDVFAHSLMGEFGEFSYRVSRVMLARFFRAKLFRYWGKVFGIFFRDYFYIKAFAEFFSHCRRLLYHVNIKLKFFAAL